MMAKLAKNEPVKTYNHKYRILNVQVIVLWCLALGKKNTRNLGVSSLERYPVSEFKKN